MKEKLITTVMYNLEGKIVKKDIEYNKIVSLNELDADTKDIITNIVSTKIEDEYNKRILFEKMLNENEDVISHNNENNNYHIELNKNITRLSDIFNVTDNFDAQKFNGKIIRNLYEIDNTFIVKLSTRYRDNLITLQLLNPIDFINFAMINSNFNECEYINCKKYKGIKYNRINHSYSGYYYRIEIENDNVFTPILNKLIRENLKHNNINLKTEKDVKEYIDFILEDVEFINNITIDYINYKTQKALEKLDGDFEYIIRRSFEKGIITGIRDIEVIKNEYTLKKPLIQTIKAIIYIKDKIRILKIEEYENEGKVISVLK